MLAKTSSGSLRTRHRLRRLDRAAAGKDGQAAEDGLLLRREEIVAPGDRIAHRLLAGREGAGAARQERQPLLQPLQQRLRREDLDPRGGQLDGQRQPVEPGADLGHGGRVGSGHGEVRLDRLRPLDEQAHRLVLAQALDRRQVGRIGQRERCQRVFLLAVGMQRDAAGHQHLDGSGAAPGASATSGAASTTRSKLSSTRRRRLPPSTALRRAAVTSPSRTPSTAPIAAATRAGIVERAQIDEPDAIGEVLQEVGGHLQRQPRLAHPAGSGERQQAHVVPPRAGRRPGNLLLPPEKRGRLERQVVGAGRQRPQRREVGGQIGMEQLEDALGAVEVAQRVLAEVAQARLPVGAHPGPDPAWPGRGAPARHARPPSRRASRLSPGSEVVAVAWRRGSGVQRHPHAQWPDLLWPRLAAAAPAAQRAAAATASGAVGKAACTASPTILNSTPPCASMAARKQRQMALDGSRHRHPVPLPERGTALDVGEEEGDGAGGQIGHDPLQE